MIGFRRQIPSAESTLTRSPYTELLTTIAEENPAFQISGRHHLVYEIHEGLVLSGFTLDLSGMEKGAFYLTAFAQPLYVPHNYIFLTLGKRLPEKTRFRVKQTQRRKLTPENRVVLTEGVLKSIRSEGLSFLRRLNSVKKIATVTEARPGTAKNPFEWRDNDPNVTEVRAYSRALLGDETRAKRDLLYLTENYLPAYDWGKELQKRGAKVLQAMEQGMENAQALLRDWAKQSTASLGLTQTP
jgi:hypothetical protein